MKHIFPLILFFSFLPILCSGQFSRSNEKIAPEIYTIVANTKWENENNLSEFKIGVLDTEIDFYHLLQEKYSGLKIEGKKVNILHFTSIENIEPTQVICVDKKFNRIIKQIVAATEGKGTLIITNNCKKNDYTMVDFNGIFKKDKFSVNSKNIEKAGLVLSPDLFKFSEGKMSWQDLYIKSEIKLKKELENIEKHKNTINSQQTTIVGQKQTLDEEEKILIQQNLTLGRQKAVLNNQELKINKQNEVLIKQLEKIGMQRTILILSGVLSVFILGLCFFIFFNYRLKKNANKTITQKNLHLNEANEKISTQSDVITAHSELVTKQKERIENIHMELTDSIHYAHQIQNAVLPNAQNIRENVPGDYFVLFKPKNIVSVDFFFVENRKNWTVVAVADCTGHGVPGALLSMLCISLLHQIVRKQEYMKANLILNELRKKVIDSFQQNGSQVIQKDGMDISLVLINRETLECHWAGANNPLYMISSQNNELCEIIPDKRPIGVYPNMKEFTNHEIKTQAGDTLYLFTDGYADQFGGPKGKKFLNKQFKEILLENSNKSMAEQNEILDQVIEDWKSSHENKQEQIDDITIFGIKLDRFQLN